MSDILDQAYAAISRLPPIDQQAIAAIILEEIASDERWQTSLEKSQDALGRLADEALNEHRSGTTRPLDPDA